MVEGHVFEHLIESNRKSDRRRLAGVGLVSLTFHSALIAAAVYATLGATGTDTDVIVDTTLVYLNQPQQQEEQPKVVELDIPLKGFQTLIAPTSIPTDIPAIDLHEKFDPRDYTGTGVEGGIGTGMPSDQVYSEAIVQEKPEWLSTPFPTYPPLLKQAGIEGTVMVEVIVDTAGRAEPNSIRIVSSPNPGFDRPVRDAVRQWLFRPARVYGRPVRVLVRIPIKFRLTP